MPKPSERKNTIADIAAQMDHQQAADLMGLLDGTLPSSTLKTIFIWDYTTFGFNYWHRQSTNGIDTSRHFLRDLLATYIKQHC